MNSVRTRLRSARAVTLGPGAIAFSAVILAIYVVWHLRQGLNIAGLAVWPTDCETCPGLAPYDLASAIAALALMATAGSAAAAIIGRSHFRGSERVVAWAVLAFAWIVIPASIVGAVGDGIGRPLLKAPLGPTLSATAAAIVVSIALARGWRPGLPRLTFPKPTAANVVVGITSLVLILLAVVVAVRHPPLGFDEATYHLPLSVFYWRDGTISGFLAQHPANWPLAHPGVIELWSGLLWVTGGERLAVLGQLPFALLGAAGVYSLSRRLGAPQQPAFMAALIFMAAPMVALQSGRAANDVAGASLVVAAAVFISAPNGLWGRGRTMLVAVTLGLVTVTKLALLPAVAALGLVFIGILFARALSHRGSDATGIRSPITSLTVELLIAGALFAIAVGPWWLRNIAQFGNPIYPAGLPILGHGVTGLAANPKDLQFVPRRWAWPLYPLLEPHNQASGIGAAVAAFLIPAVGIASLRSRARPLLIIAVVGLISLPVWWFSTRHEPRFLLGWFALLIALLPLVFVGVQARWRPAMSALMTTAVVMSGVITITTGLARDASLPTDPATYYREVWSVDVRLLGLPAAEGVLLDDECGPRTRVPLTAALGHDQQRRTARAECGSSTAAVVALMRQNDLRWVYVSATADATHLSERYPAAAFELAGRSSIQFRNGMTLERRLYSLR